MRLGREMTTPFRDLGLDSAGASIIFRAMSVTSELRRRVRAERSHSPLRTLFACPAKHPPAGSGWIHEIKHDGFRIIAQRDAIAFA